MMASRDEIRAAAEQMIRACGNPLRDARSRAEMAREGMSPELIDSELERIRFADLVKCHGLAKARDIVYSEQPDQPHDRRYRPDHGDPLLRGQARAVGQAAAAVKRGRTVTDWQYAEREERTRAQRLADRRADRARFAEQLVRAREARRT